MDATPRREHNSGQRLSAISDLPNSQIGIATGKVGADVQPVDVVPGVILPERRPDRVAHVSRGVLRVVAIPVKIRRPIQIRPIASQARLNGVIDGNDLVTP